MKKVFISQPMSGLTIEQIKEDRERCIKVIKDEIGDDFEVIDNLQENKNYPHKLYYLSEDLKFLSEADVVFFATGWDDARGCEIEWQAAKNYLDPDKTIFMYEDVLKYSI